MKKRILFVDDEPNVLEGLRRMLRAQRDQWNMRFVSSADEGFTGDAARGELPGRNVGRIWRFARMAIQHYLSQGADEAFYATPTETVQHFMRPLPLPQESR